MSLDIKQPQWEVKKLNDWTDTKEQEVSDIQEQLLVLGFKIDGVYYVKIDLGTF